jgi:hypothetical protein
MKNKLTEQKKIEYEFAYEIQIYLILDNKYYDHIYYTDSAKPSDIKDDFISFMSLISLNSIECFKKKIVQNNKIGNKESKIYLRIFDKYDKYIAEKATEEDYQVYIKLLEALKYKN